VCRLTSLSRKRCVSVFVPSSVFFHIFFLYDRSFLCTCMSLSFPFSLFYFFLIPPFCLLTPSLSLSWFSHFGFILYVYFFLLLHLPLIILLSFMCFYLSFCFCPSSCPYISFITTWSRIFWFVLSVPFETWVRYVTTIWIFRFLFCNNWKVVAGQFVNFLKLKLVLIV
jgi:hypothetical protein